MRRVGAEMLLMAAIGLVAALTGPFGTWAASWPVRLAEWQLFMLGGYACFRPVLAGGTALAAASRLPRPAATAIACLLAALPTTLIVAAALAGLDLGRLTVADLAALYPQVLLIGALATLAQAAAAHRTALPPADPAVPEPPPVMVASPEPDGPDAFLRRLPPHLGRDLVALEQEDHYLRAHTGSGSALILMRMRDAADELAGADGLRVHRSWWVARAAVAGVERRERAVWLRLANGLEVPVARASVPTLREAGWL